jgi:hypothetical protein
VGFERGERERVERQDVLGVLRLAVRLDDLAIDDNPGDLDSKASALRAAAGPASRRALPWAARPAHAGPHSSSANIDQRGPVVLVCLVPAGHRHVIGGRGSAVCLVLCAVPHPLWIVSTDDGPVNPS